MFQPHGETQDADATVLAMVVPGAAQIVVLRAEIARLLAQSQDCIEQAASALEESSQLQEGARRIACLLADRPAWLRRVRTEGRPGQDTQARAINPRRIGAAERQRGRVLLIENDDFVSSVVHGLLGQIGIAVEVARDGDEGIRKVKGRQFQAVIVDLTLPGMNGLDVARKVRRLSSRTPVALLSGDPQYLEAVSDSGSEFDVLMHKPIQAAELYGAVDRLVGRASVRRSA
jgi:CheY-like chemotaxis protein